MISTRYGLGHIPDLASHREEALRFRHIGGLVGTSTVMASSRDWRHFDPTDRDQGRTNTCTCQTASAGIYMAGQAAAAFGRGDAIPRPSVLYPYGSARLVDQELDGVPPARRQLVDLGVRPGSVISALETYGIVSEEKWPFSEGAVNDDLPLDADIAAADALLTGNYAIGGPDTALLMRMALDKAQFPQLAIDVYKNFEDADGNDPYDDVAGEWQGRHMLLAVGYRPGQILVRNWWTRRWADEGYIWMTDRFINGPNVRDCSVLTSAPKIKP